MPLVRIDLPEATPPEAVRAVADRVHEALVESFSVPVADRFQIVARHGRDALFWPPEFLQVAHGERAVFVQIHCAPGRTTAQKKALYAAIADGIAMDGHFAPADMIINLVETARENWSFGLGIAQYAA